MKTFTKAALAGAMLLSSGMLAMASDYALSAEKEAEIKAVLVEQGYEVRSIQTEDGMFEAYVIKDGIKQEVYLSADLKIVNVKSAD